METSVQQMKEGFLKAISMEISETKKTVNRETQDIFAQKLEKIQSKN